MKEKEYKPRTEKDNLLKGVSPDLVEKFGEENLKNLIVFLENSGKELFGETEDNIYENSAAYHDYLHHVLRGKNLFSDDKETFLSEAEKRHLLKHDVVDEVQGYIIPEIAFYVSRTGEKFGSPKQQKARADFIEKEFQSISQINLHFVQPGTYRGELAAYYRVLTGKPIEHLLELANKNKKAKNEITKEGILKDLEGTITRSFLSTKDYFYFPLNEIAAYRILTAKEIKIIPGKGIIFPEASGKIKPPQGISSTL